MSTILLKGLSEKHYSRQIAGDVGEICEPLKVYGITYFMYSRFFYDGTNYVLTNSWDPYYNHCQKKYSISPSIPKEIIGNKFFYLPAMVDDSVYNHAYYDWRNLFNIGHPIYFIEYGANYFDLVIYASTPDNYNIVNTYLNNIEILKKFKLFFKDKAKKIINKSHNNRILVPNNMRYNFDKARNRIEEATYRKKLLKLFEIKKYSCINENKEIFLSKREIEVIRELSRGFTFKETGKILDISSRTVETYFNSIKSKLKLEKRSDIIRVIAESELL